MQKISVIVPNLFSKATYFSPDFIPAGTFVRVPFGKKEIIGVVWNDIPDAIDEKKIKKVIDILPVKPLNKTYMGFIDWVSKYTLTPKGLVLKMGLIPDIEKKTRNPIVFQKSTLPVSELSFSEEQEKAIQSILNFPPNRPILLDGITGSGKTEVYFEIIANALKNSHQALILLPEITLTSSFLDRFEKRFGNRGALWHSSLSPKVRRDTWRAVANNQVDVVIGTRSALFLPFDDLGIIVVDEEHDSSFKQEDGVIYNGKDMAIVRAHLEKIPIILSSATPSLETITHAQNGKYNWVCLKHRFSKSPLPDVQLIDMNLFKKSIISPTLIGEIEKNLQKKEQTLLFLNRRGYAPIKICQKCSHTMKCPRCSVNLTIHRHSGNLICHHCGYQRKEPDLCPVCQTEMIDYGIGVEKVATEIKKLFPNAKVKLVSSDTISNMDEIMALSTEVQSGEIDILIGTQILSKGHHFPNLTLVGILDADFGLSGSDLRASERTFQLLHQVGGRAGRSQKAGRVFIQTFSPQHPTILALSQNNRQAFLEQEIQSRRLLSFPPFGRLASIIISGTNEKTTQKFAHLIMSKVPYMTDVNILGPIQAPLYKLNRKYRWRILISAKKNISVQTIIKNWILNIKVPSSVCVRFDIDPYNFS